jgi:hypothetical protein
MHRAVSRNDDDLQDRRYAVVGQQELPNQTVPATWLERSFFGRR